MTYKLNQDRYGDISSVTNEEARLCIPFDPANTDYQKFKSDVASGVELQDPDGNVMTPEQVQEFLSTLP